MHDGTLALSRIEANGIRVDEKYIDSKMQELQTEISTLKSELQGTKIWRGWSKRYGSKANLTSGEQLGVVLFEMMGLEGGERLPSGKWSTDGEALAKIDHPFVKKWSSISSRVKLRNTFLAGIKEETVDGFLHPVFNLHITRTFRSSSDSPNFQNFPVRIPWMAETIRSAFIPRHPSRRILEIDFGGIEVKVAACYHKDPTMIRYIKDPTKDMHADMAAECFKCRPDQVSKQMRYCGKNMFVFPQFYGDYFLNNAVQLWRAIDTFTLDVEGIPARQWLEKKGITELGSTDPEDRAGKGTFIHHLSQVEKNFWQVRFAVYAAWKKKWYDRYLRTGGFNTLTGFALEGVYSRNDVINYPVQGSAFHCLLWSLIQLQKWLNKNKMSTVIIGQIHDSLVLDVHRRELDDVLEMAEYIMTKALLEAWDWIIVPMEVEAEVTEPGASWFTKKKVKKGE